MALPVRTPTLSQRTSDAMVATMTRACAIVALLAALILPTAAYGAVLTGIVIYSTDDFGNPSGYDWDREQIWAGELWRTQVHSHWYGLGIAARFPPDSLRSAPLNAPDFSIAIALVEGNNDFTLLGTYGTGSELDQRYALNLFFDGVQESPGISVLFTRQATWDAAPPSPNLSEILTGLSVDSVRTSPQMTYFDGVDTVSVMEVHFLPIDAFPHVDLVSIHSPSPGDGEDRIGILRIIVEGPTGQPGAGLRDPGPRAFGMIPGGEPAHDSVGVGPSLPNVVAAPWRAQSQARLVEEAPPTWPSQPESEQPTAIETPRLKDDQQEKSETVLATPAGTPSGTKTTPPPSPGTPTAGATSIAGSPTPKNRTSSGSRPQATQVPDASPPAVAPTTGSIGTPSVVPATPAARAARHPGLICDALPRSVMRPPMAGPYPNDAEAMLEDSPP